MGSNYYRAKKALPKRRCLRCSTPKWERKSNQQTLDKAIAAIIDTLDLQRAQDILGVGRPETARSILRKHRRYEYDQYVENVKSKKMSIAGVKGAKTVVGLRRKREQRLSEGGFNIKDYWAYLNHSCQTKREATTEISLLNSTIKKTSEESKPHVELDILRRKLGMAKRHFMQLKY